MESPSLTAQRTKTTMLFHPSILSPDYPRMRGVHRLPVFDHPIHEGSSPHTRGPPPEAQPFSEAAPHFLQGLWPFSLNQAAIRKSDNPSQRLYPVNASIREAIRLDFSDLLLPVNSIQPGLSCRYPFQLFHYLFILSYLLYFYDNFYFFQYLSHPPPSLPTIPYYLCKKAPSKGNSS